LSHNYCPTNEQHASAIAKQTLQPSYPWDATGSRSGAICKAVASNNSCPWFDAVIIQHLYLTVAENKEK